jgi:hypothetical protein
MVRRDPPCGSSLPANAVHAILRATRVRRAALGGMTFSTSSGPHSPVDDVPFRVQRELAFQATHATDPSDRPRGTELGSMGRRRRSYDQLFEAVLEAAFTGERTSNALGASLIDRFGQPDSSPRGFLASTGPAPSARGVSDAPLPEPADALRTSRKPPNAPITPAASTGRKIVDPFP